MGDWDPLLEEIRNRLRPSEVIGQRVTLTRAGREHKACCPFHHEKSPSFTVSDDKGFYHCFGCGVHGDIIKFVMEYDRLEFKDAVEKLANQCGLELPKPTRQSREKAERLKTLHDATELACSFFQQALHKPEGRAALGYLRGRGVTDREIDFWRLGYAPADSQALIRHLSGKGISDKQMIEAGLARKSDRDGSMYSFFRDRVLFPVRDRKGRPVAFGGRLLDGDGPKYINSADSPIFHKGGLLYGLYEGMDALRESRVLVVVEGYMDVIALARTGLAAPVAPLGTAMTEDQAQLVWQRLAPDRDAPVPILCFDGDTAGQRAAARAVERVTPFLGPGRTFRIAFLPEGHDPDSLIEEQGNNAMRGVLDASRPVVDVMWSVEMAGRDLSTPEARAGFEGDLMARVGRIEDAPTQNYYRTEFQRRLSDAFPRFTPRKKGDWQPRQGGGGKWQGAGNKRGGYQAPQAPVQRRRPNKGRHAERLARVALACLINHPDLLDDNAEKLASLDMPHADLRRLRDSLFDALAEGAEGREEVHEALTLMGAHQAMAELLSPATYTDGPFARPDSQPVEAARGLADLFAILESAGGRASARATASRYRQQMQQDDD